MDTKNYNLKEMKTSELKEINGGLIVAVGVVVGVATLALAGATALGYYDGKKNCMPPPCT